MQTREKSAAVEDDYKCRLCLGNNARLEGEGADNGVIAAGQVVEVIVVIDARLQPGLLVGSGGRSA